MMPNVCGSVVEQEALMKFQALQGNRNVLQTSFADDPLINKKPSFTSSMKGEASSHSLQ
eukprot:m.121561 g.121561  ORF g.121561 m.121561 type:complete len:59 (-) comp15524_c0_seq1:1473-1649(-)